MTAEPCARAGRVFWIVDNVSSHRGTASIKRMTTAWPNAHLIHLPAHASWLDQAGIYFSVVQRKALTPNGFTSLDQIRERLAAFEVRYNATARPFNWNFTRTDLDDLLQPLRRPRQGPAPRHGSMKLHPRRTEGPRPRVAAVHADTQEALTALAAGTRDVDDLRLLTGIIGVESSGQARQIPRKLLPPTNRYRPDPPPSESSSAEHSSARGWPRRSHHGRHRGTVSDCDEVPTRSLLLPPSGASSLGLWCYLEFSGRLSGMSRGLWLV